jgi:tRNA-dihydrouridine synthase
MAHTEMSDPGGFARSLYYRTQMLGAVNHNDSDMIDRPLVLQLGGSNIPKLLEAIQVAISTNVVDAIELNCGCPQRCAQKGNYGAFLLENPPTLLHIIETLRYNMPPEMPLLVKMRVFKSIEDTVALAKRIVQAGAGILTVHGRTRHQGGGAKTSGYNMERLASWPHIRAVKQAVPVPVIANGNVPCPRAVNDILEFTGCDGVMSGCGLLRDPTLFATAMEQIEDTADTIDNDPSVPGDDYEYDDDDDDDNDQSQHQQNHHNNQAWDKAVGIAREYIDLAITYQTNPTRVSKHLIWMLDKHGFKCRAPDLRNQTLQLRFGPEKGGVEQHYINGSGRVDDGQEPAVTNTEKENKDNGDKCNHDIHGHQVGGVAKILAKLSKDLLHTTSATS